MLYNRETKKLEEDYQHGAKALNFLYNTAIGRILLKIIINPIISKIIGFYHDTFLSKNKINKFITKHNIQMDNYIKKDYKNFNEFFTREKNNKEIKTNKGEFYSPADSKLLIYKIDKNQKVTIKNSTYTLDELVDNKIDMEEYKNGYCLVFRLALDDYHRYCFPTYGEVKDTISIKGKLHTVSSISKDYKIYSKNHRVITTLDTKEFNDLIYIEVGALSVGKIINHNLTKFKSCEEKGYFKMGGSTIVILVKPNTLEIDKDILNNATKEIEVKLKYGEKIGIKK